MVRCEIHLQPLHPGSHYDENDAVAQVDSDSPHPFGHTAHLNPIYEKPGFTSGEEGVGRLIWALGELDIRVEVN